VIASIEEPEVIAKILAQLEKTAPDPLLQQDVRRAG